MQYATIFSTFKTFLTTNSTPTQFISFHYGRISKKTNSSTSTVVHAAEKDSHHYEIDPDKAKEALKKLDQQLHDLSKKQVAPPKIKLSDIKITRDEVQAMTGSELGAVAAILFLFTIFYNIFYLTVLEPSVENPPPPPPMEIQTPSPQ